jgi:hypothetical protein
MSHTDGFASKKSFCHEKLLRLVNDKPDKVPVVPDIGEKGAKTEVLYKTAEIIQEHCQPARLWNVNFI